MEKDTIVEVVKTLVGNIHPIGDSHTDKERLENAKQLTEVIDELIHYALVTMVTSENVNEHSRKVVYEELEAWADRTLKY